MSNKRKTNTLDPTRINNYNKFLSTLDQSLNLKPNNENISYFSEDENKNKNKLDDIILNVNNKFKLTNYLSPNFTGQKQSDIYCSNNIDPNSYRDIIHKNNKIYFNYAIFTCKQF